MDTNEEELELLNIQTLITWVLLGSLVVSLIIGQNARIKLEGGEPFWTDEEVKTITVWTRWIVLIAAIVAIAANYKVLQIQKERNADPKDIDAANLEFWAAIIAGVAAVLILIAVSEATAGDESIDVENPEL